MGFFDYHAAPLPILRHLHSLCRGAVIASFPSRHWLRTPIRRFRPRLHRIPVYFYDRSDLASLGEQAGFARTEIVKLPGAGMNYFVTMWHDNAL